MPNTPTYEELEKRIQELEKEASKLRKAEKAIRESEARYRLLFNSGNDAVFVHQPTAEGMPGKFIEVNDAACQRYGYTREEFFKLTPLDLAAPEKRGGVPDRVSRTLAEGHILFETEQITKDGRRILGEVHSHLFTLNGQPTVLSVARDISDRKRIEEALRESEAQKRAILDVSIDWIRYVDKEMRIMWANKTTAMAVGMPPEDLVGQVCHKLFVDRDIPCEGCPAVKARESGQIERATIHHPRMKGVEGESYWDVYCAPLRNEEGDIKGLIQVSRNITEQKRAEVDIRFLSQQLLKAQETEREMISRELHDGVGQDLASVKIGFETLFGNLPAEIRHRISEFSKMLQDSISAIRELAYDLRPPTLDKLGIVQAISHYCNDFSENTGLNVDLTSAGMEDLKLDFDTEINLYRLIQEGLNNVRKHADANNVKIKVVFSFPNIILRIEDDGEGFDVKERMAATIDEKRMGLRSMQERVNLLQGKMRIESRPMQGTRIFIQVPYREKQSGSKEKHLDH